MLAIEISEKARNRSNMKTSAYRGGRLGYQYFEEEIAQELLKQGIHVDHVPRHETWIRAHSRQKDGVIMFDNPINQEIANAINALKAKSQRGEIVIEGRRDNILSRELKKPEHGGRVGGVASGITNKEYFGHNTPTPPIQLHSQINELKRELELMRNNQNLLMSMMMSGEQTNHLIASRGQGNCQFGGISNQPFCLNGQFGSGAQLGRLVGQTSTNNNGQFDGVGNGLNQRIEGVTIPQVSVAPQCELQEQQPQPYKPQFEFQEQESEP